MVPQLHLGSHTSSCLKGTPKQTFPQVSNSSSWVRIRPSLLRPGFISHAPYFLLEKSARELLAVNVLSLVLTSCWSLHLVDPLAFKSDWADGGQAKWEVSGLQRLLIMISTSVVGWVHHFRTGTLKKGQLYTFALCSQSYTGDNEGRRSSVLHWGLRKGGDLQSYTGGWRRKEDPALHQGIMKRTGPTQSCTVGRWSKQAIIRYW